mmetsp:Transcript_59510/g.192492  ORF Transcript_59510/g.192492 Transcript_59510/m.192492 type:complete len:124 (+) Transcript_59510:885-1256(+)
MLCVSSRPPRGLEGPSPQGALPMERETPFSEWLRGVLQSFRQADVLPLLGCAATASHSYASTRAFRALEDTALSLERRDAVAECVKHGCSSRRQSRLVTVGSRTAVVLCRLVTLVDLLVRAVS